MLSGAERKVLKRHGPFPFAAALTTTTNGPGAECGPRLLMSPEWSKLFSLRVFWSSTKTIHFFIICDRICKHNFENMQLLVFTFET